MGKIKVTQCGDIEKYRIEKKNNNENIERGVNRVEGIKSERKNGKNKSNTVRRY